MAASVKTWNEEITFLCPTWNEACLHRVDVSFQQGNKTCGFSELWRLCQDSVWFPLRAASDLRWTADAWLWERGHLLPGSRPSQPGTQLSLHMILLEPRLCLCIITPLNVTLLIKISVFSDLINLFIIWLMLSDGGGGGGGLWGAGSPQNDSRITDSTQSG